MKVPEPDYFFQCLEHDTKTLLSEGVSKECVERMRVRRIKRFTSQVEYYERMSGRSVY